MDVNDSLSPAASGKFIAENSVDVQVNRGGVEAVAKMILEALKDGSIKAVDYKENPLHPQIGDGQSPNWVLLMDSINFSFWPEEGRKYCVTYKGKLHTGYMACAAALNKALDAGIPVTSAQWMQEVTVDELDTVLKSDSGDSIPLIDERLEVVHETGRVLNREFGGDFLNVIPTAGNSAQGLLKIILENFTHFSDFCEYRQRKVSILKRAQILVSDVYGILSGKSDTVIFPDIGSLTMFADYRVPQVLAYMNVLVYSPALRLLRVLEERELICYGDEMEVELRGCSIHACQEIVRVIREKRELDQDEKWGIYREVHAIDVDVWLWQYRRDHSAVIDAFVPHHRTRSIYY